MINGCLKKASKIKTNQHRSPEDNMQQKSTLTKVDLIEKTIDGHPVLLKALALIPVALAVGVFIAISVTSWDASPKFSAIIFTIAGLGMGYLKWGTKTKI